jgi:hypothetical protein
LPSSLASGRPWDRQPAGAEFAVGYGTLCEREGIIR